MNLVNFLQTLDISYSRKVSDIGLVQLCGISPTGWTGFDHFSTSTGIHSFNKTCKRVILPSNEVHPLNYCKK